MGRKSTKENKSIWQTTREELGLTREKAGELSPGFSPERIEKIENGRTLAHVMVIKALDKFVKRHYLAVILGAPSQQRYEIDYRLR